jgi:hypothetical protein
MKRLFLFGPDSPKAAKLCGPHYKWDHRAAPMANENRAFDAPHSFPMWQQRAGID